MSGFALLSIGSRAMAANYAALQTTGHNIANAGVEGYSRQRVETATASARATAGGFIGGGVDVQTVTRAHDQFLTREAANAQALAAMDASRLESLKHLEEVFRPGEQGIGYAASDFLNAMVDMASRPADLAARQVVLSRAATVTERIRAAGTQLDALQQDVATSVGQSVARANDLVRGIAELNVRIQSAGQAQPANDLLDERDRLVSRLSEIVQVKTIPSADGSLSVFFAGGTALVNGSRRAELQVVTDPDDPMRVALEVGDNGNMRAIDAADLGGGSIAGWLRFQGADLQQARASLGQMVVALAGAVNDQQARGLDLRQPAGRGAALFDVPAPLVQPARTNERDASGGFVASVRMEVVDPRLLQASDYALRADAAGNWTVERLSDGATFEGITSGSEFDGLRIDFGPAAPAKDDRFLLQGVSRAASGLRLAVQDPRALAAAGLLAAVPGQDNQGTASVSSLRVTDAQMSSTLDAEVAFAGNGVFELRDRSNGSVLATAAWTSGQPLAWDVADPALTGFELVIDGEPAAGDVFSLSRPVPVASDNTNALALADLRDSRLFGLVADAQGGLQGGSTLTEAWTAILSRSGVQVQAAESAAQISQGVADDAEGRRAARSGVSLDEEAARLIQYQQSYQAAAKVLQVAQAVFDTLLQTADR
jgi:flagellar hook-associated protein 1 FlgK